MQCVDPATAPYSGATASDNEGKPSCYFFKLQGCPKHDRTWLYGSAKQHSLSYSISGSWRFGNILESLKRHMLSHDRLLQMELSVQWNSRPIVSLVQLGKTLLFWKVNVSVIFSTFLFKALLLLLFSCQVMSDSLRPHGLQHARPPVPHHLPEFAQVHVHWISDAIQPPLPVLCTRQFI